MCPPDFWGWAGPFPPELGLSFSPFALLSLAPLCPSLCPPPPPPRPLPSPSPPLRTLPPSDVARRRARRHDGGHVQVRVGTWCGVGAGKQKEESKMERSARKGRAVTPRRAPPDHGPLPSRAHGLDQLAYFVSGLGGCGARRGPPRSPPRGRLPAECEGRPHAMRACRETGARNRPRQRALPPRPRPTLARRGCPGGRSTHPRAGGWVRRA